MINWSKTTSDRYSCASDPPFPRAPHKVKKRFTENPLFPHPGKNQRCSLYMARIGEETQSWDIFIRLHQQFSFPSSMRTQHKNGASPFAVEKHRLSLQIDGAPPGLQLQNWRATSQIDSIVHEQKKRTRILRLLSAIFAGK